MKTKIHALAGCIGFLTILTFWTSTVVTELFASHETIAAIKSMILPGMFILIPAMAIAGGSGMAMGKKRTDAQALAKKKRMPIIAANGLLILLPSAIFLASKAARGEFDGWFYGVQALELMAGAANLTMMGLNIRDGLRMTGRIGGTDKPRQVAASDGVIEERDGGPLVAKGISRLTGPDNEAIETKPVMALCRCGASKNKPFCDGSHNEIGFDSQPSDKRVPDRLKVYSGGEIDVHFNLRACSHSAQCIKRLKPVFDVKRKPWIIPDNGTSDDIIAVIEACPSGALSFSRAGEDPRHLSSEAPGITIEPGGPYRVSAIPCSGSAPGKGACPEKYVLCRCGASTNKPYCDGSHQKIKWDG